MVVWFTLLTIALPWVGAACVWLAGDRRPRVLNGLAVGFAVATGLISLGMIPFARQGAVVRIPLGGVFGDFTLVPDGLGACIAVIAAVVGSLAVIFSLDYMKPGEQLARYYALILFFIGAMAGVGLAGSLLLMFLFWEITAFCSYALISFHNDDPKAVKGGIQALLMTQLGGIGLLAGSLLALTYLGNSQISTFLAQAHTIPAGILSVIAFGFLAVAAASPPNSRYIHGFPMRWKHRHRSQHSSMRPQWSTRVSTCWPVFTRPSKTYRAGARP